MIDAAMDVHSLKIVCKCSQQPYFVVLSKHSRAICVLACGSESKCFFLSLFPWESKRGILFSGKLLFNSTYSYRILIICCYFVARD